MIAKSNMWNSDKEDVELTEFDYDTKVTLGCENEPVIKISDWMDQENINTLEEMAGYIDDLDFNIALA